MKEFVFDVTLCFAPTMSLAVQAENEKEAIEKIKSLAEGNDSDNSFTLSSGKKVSQVQDLIDLVCLEPRSVDLAENHIATRCESNDVLMKPVIVGDGAVDLFGKEYKGTVSGAMVYFRDGSGSEEFEGPLTVDRGEQVYSFKYVNGEGSLIREVLFPVRAVRSIEFDYE